MNGSPLGGLELYFSVDAAEVPAFLQYSLHLQQLIKIFVVMIVIVVLLLLLLLL